ncbi:hypothetical protein GCM10022279_05090 [Comamonas faecalis]|uniref:Uncharacterized protein n=1 Tax=Comamonas faecalis TaxID=1387849 RepID=A0ABP7QPQ6_9BURK
MVGAARVDGKAVRQGNQGRIGHGANQAKVQREERAALGGGCAAGHRAKVYCTPAAR